MIDAFTLATSSNFLISRVLSQIFFVDCYYIFFALIVEAWENKLALFIDLSSILSKLCFSFLKIVSLVKDYDFYLFFAIGVGCFIGTGTFLTIVNSNDSGESYLSGGLGPACKLLLDRVFIGEIGFDWEMFFCWLNLPWLAPNRSSIEESSIGITLLDYWYILFLDLISLNWLLS